MTASVASWSMTTSSARCFNGIIITVEFGMNKAISKILFSLKCQYIYIYNIYTHTCTFRVIRPTVDNFESRLNSSHRVLFKSFCVQILVSILANSFLYNADSINLQ